MKLGIYIHWPFCESKCPYCDFNSYTFDSVDYSAWERAFIKELERYHRMTPHHIVNSVFFGGGTPSLMPDKIVSSIISKVLSLWKTNGDIEISLEANPSSFEISKFRDYHSAGVNRISIGVQSFNNHNLKTLGRLHSAQQSIEAVEKALSVYKNVSFDMIYGLPNQNIEEWEKELKFALNLGTNHISLYELTIEKGTPFFQLHEMGKMLLPPKEELEEMYFLNREMCAKHGLETYEISNFALPGWECKHNLIYWEYNDYVGCGPGAHGRITIEGTKNATLAISSPNDWLQNVDKITSDTITPLSREEARVEYLISSLRSSMGLCTKKYFDISKEPFPSKVLEDWEKYKLATKDPKGIIRFTQKGYAISNKILYDLIELLPQNTK